MAEAMKAIVQSGYGRDAEQVFALGEVPVPEPGEGEVLVRVAATSVDMGTWHLMAGMPYPVRLVFGLRRPKLLNPAFSVSGMVAALGPGVTGLAAGDEVYGIARCAFAPFAVGKAAKIVARPANLSWEEAAGLPISGLTALQAVRDHARPRPGERALVTGASGGVGSLVVQLLKAAGAEVTASCSGAKEEYVRSLGADHVIDRRVRDPLATDEPYDIVVDIAGNPPVRRLRRALTPRGRAVVVGGETGGRVTGGLDRTLRAALVSPFVSQQLRAFVSSENTADLIALREEAEAGRLRVPVDAVHPLREAAQAVRHVAEGRARGKVIVTI